MPSRESVRQSIADRPLNSLEQLTALHAELIAAEAAHKLAVECSALHRHPPLR